MRNPEHAPWCLKLHFIVKYFHAAFSMNDFEMWHKQNTSSESVYLIPYKN